MLMGGVGGGNREQEIESQRGLGVLIARGMSPRRQEETSVWLSLGMEPRGGRGLEQTAPPC